MRKTSIFLLILAFFVLAGCDKLKGKNEDNTPTFSSANNAPGMSEYKQGDEAYYDGNYAKAFDLYTKAANKGLPEAQYELGLMYDDEDDDYYNPEEAVRWYKKAAEQGHPNAQYNLAVSYDFGDGVREDDSLAMSWYTKAAAQGHADAQYNLALMYENGEGLEKPNFDKAIEYYTKAANQNHRDATNNLGYLYDEHLGKPKEAYKWYILAAKLGSDDAAYNIGMLYEYGNMGKEDYTTACAWYYLSGDEDAVDECDEKLTNIQAKRVESIMKDITKELGL